MTYLDVHKAIAKRLTDEWGSRTLIVHPNLKPPRSPEKEEWIAYSVNGAEAFTAGIGGGPGANLIRHPGTLYVRCFGPKEASPQAALENADEVCNVFRHWRDQASGLEFRAPPYTVPGDDPDWFQINVVAPFLWDATQ